MLVARPIGLAAGRENLPRNRYTILAETSPGLLIVSQQTSILVAIEELLLIWTASEAEEWINRTCFIPL